jgi:hypothetical protein
MPAELVVSLVALLVAIASLYLSALRPGQVAVDHVQMADSFGPEGFDVLPGSAWEMPAVRFVQVALAATNPSRRPAVLERIELTGFEYLGAKPEVFLGFGEQHLSESLGQADAPVDLPIALRGDEARTLRLTAELGRGFGTMNPRNWARGLRSFEGVRATVEWSYTQPRPLWWRFVPGRRELRRRTVTGRFSITVSGREFRAATVRYWRGKRDVHHEQLANVIEGLPIDTEAVRRAAPLGGIRRAVPRRRRPARASHRE